SIDESTRRVGGDLGYLAASQLEAPVAKAAFGVQEGQVYGPVKGSHGWNVGVVAAVAPIQPARYADVKAAFRKQLQQEQEVRIWTDWLAKVIREADIHYADAYRPADPDAPPPLTPATQPPPEGANP
ncbi:MAG TPA: peptidylprolyl isomerase, partial [Aeromicrobium sp.]|nr:peptidylprolyl isomerase [Aeromicrobium sp.]